VGAFSRPVDGTPVPVEEPSTASIADIELTKFASNSITSSAAASTLAVDEI
jgi:hypothetical protein